MSEAVSAAPGFSPVKCPNCGVWCASSQFPTPIPVGERLPKPIDPNPIECANYAREFLITEGEVWVLAEYRSTGWWRRSPLDGGLRQAYPSHWMELPLVPIDAGWMGPT
jgi:hypothetical protein